MEGVLTMLDKAARTLLLGGVALSFTLASNACANDDGSRPLQYMNYQNNLYNLTYDIARDAMKESFEALGGDTANPTIAIAEENLNKGKIPQIIAYPVEDYDRAGLICTKDKNYMCPHYILETRGKDTKTLAVIFAKSINLGAATHNGYHTLKITLRNEDNSKEDVEIYGYDKGKDAYVPMRPIKTP